MGGLAAILALLPAAAAHAAAPANDVPSGAVQIAALPFSAEQDTTEATTDAGDALLNQFCGAPATDASVWYSYTPTTDVVVSVNTSPSDYHTVVMVTAGPPGGLSLVACSSDGAAFLAAAGVTYSILVADVFNGDGRNGGTLRIQIDETRPVNISLTVDRVGTVNKAGVARVTGTVSCTGSDSFSLFIGLSQNVGRLTTIRSETFVDGVCDGTVPWSAQLFPFSGKFAEGRSTLFSGAFSCNVLCTDFQHEPVVVQLRGGGR